jgi:hypothetical protein
VAHNLLNKGTFGEWKMTKIDVRPIYDRYLGAIYVISIVYPDERRSEVEVTLPHDLYARLEAITDATGIKEIEGIPVVWVTHA